MKLAKYLANYIDQDLPTGYAEIPHLETIIQQGIEAFASTENKQVEVYDATDDVIEERYI